MTKRRASIRGRGAEIVFGEPPADQSEPRFNDTPEGHGTQALPVAAGVTDAFALDEELERALYDEARDGAPLPLGTLAPRLPWEDGVLSRPEVEAAMIEEAFAAEEPAQTVTAPAGGQAGGNLERVESAPAPDDEASTGVLPPRPSRSYLEPYQEAAQALDIQEPETEVKPVELPVRGVSEAERQAMLAWWGDRRIKAMSNDIDAAYQEVRQLVGENETLVTEAYNLLLKARDILIRRDAERIAQAEYYIEQVKVRLRRASASEASARKAQWPLMGWGLLWGVAFLALLIMAGMDRFQSLFLPAGQARSLVELDIFLSAMLWGGIGGAVAVLYSLFKHIGMRDFDRQYVISYVGKPFLGLIVGATVYMIVALVVRALGIVPSGQPVNEVETNPAIAPGVIYLVAWAAGFKEDRLLSLVDRLMKQIFGSSEKEEAVPSPTPGPLG